MSFKVYAAERQAGLADALSKAVAVVQADLTLPVEPPDLDKVIAKLRAEELAPDVRQPDLAWIVAVLVSTGWNKNADVFLADQTFAAKDTPVHKPINLGHDDGRIIGHMVTSKCTTTSGTLVTADEAGLPSESAFDIEVGGVLYKAVEAYADEVAAIIEEAKKGKARVSMEAYFNDIAYAFLDPKSGVTKVVARDENTAFLTKHLSAYGGNGVYEGFVLGRVLLNITFGGMGVVDQPANPRSIVKQVVAQKAAAYERVKLDEVTKGGAKDMEKELAELKAQLAAKTAQAEALTKEKAELAAKLETAAKAAAEAATTAAAEVEALKKTLAEKDEAFKGLEAKAAELGTQIETLTKRAETAEAELVTIRQAQKAQERLVALKQTTEVKDEAAALADISGLTDEAFSTMLKYAGAKAKPEGKEAPEPSDDEKAAAEAQEALDKAEPDKEPDHQAGSGEAANSDLEIAKAMASRLLRRKPEAEDEQ